MAYDPKTFLDRALKEGFQSVYSEPASREAGDAQYQGDVATFGNVQVRPTFDLVGQTEQAPGTSMPSGHMVSVPLTGQYEGYFRNDIYDTKGNFVGTTISEPDNDKYGLKGLAQLGLMAASMGGFGPLASTLAKGVSAIQSKNPLALLSAATGMPGVDKILPAMPSAVSDVLKYAGQAKDVSQALKGDPGAIFRTIVGGAKSGALPKGFTGGDLSGADAIEGFFARGGEGYDPAQEDVSSILARYPETGSVVDVAGTADDWYQEGAVPTYSGIPEWDDALDIALQTGKVPGETDQTVTTTGAKTTMPPQEMSRFLEANIDDPGTIDTLMQDYFPDLYRQTIDVTGTLPKKDVIIPDWDVLPPAVEPPKSIRDIGTVTKISPDEPLEGTTITEPDLTGGLPPAVASPAPKPAAPGKAPTPSPAPKAADENMAWLAALLGAMGQQQPTQAPSPYQTARIDAESPFGLMYGMRG